MNRQPRPLLLELTCLLGGPPARVFRAMTDPAEVVRWWGPQGFTTPHAQIDLRVGGSYRFAMQPPEGDVFHLFGEFLRIDPPNSLSYSFQWDPPDPDDRQTVVALSLNAVGNATEVTLAQGEFATQARLVLHRDGWTDSFEKLRGFINKTQ